MPIGEKVAVIIVTWNSSALLNDVLSSLEQQTFKPKRVLVVDNGSYDIEDEVKVVEKFTDVELISLSENLGFAAANNLGINKCEDVDYIALLNPDAFPQPEWLANLVYAAKNNKCFSSFSSRLLNHSDKSILDGAGDSLSISGRPKRRGHGSYAEGVFTQFDQVFSPSAAAALYQRSALVAVGGFDEDFFCYIEDVDLGFRLRLAGYKTMYVPNAIVYHVGSATTGGQHSDFSVYHGHRNLVWAFIKNMPSALFILFLPLHLMLNLFSIFWFSAKGQGGVIVKAKIDAIKGIPVMWRKRKEIQAKRRASVLDIWHVLDKRT